MGYLREIEEAERVLGRVELREERREVDSLRSERLIGLLKERMKLRQVLGLRQSLYVRH
jgi:hypothetical protein